MPARDEPKSIEDAQRELERLRREIDRSRDECERLRDENARLELERERLRREIERLTAALEAARRAGTRQAAPFSKGAPTARARPPGRRAGRRHGRHAHRQPPAALDERKRYSASIVQTARLRDLDPRAVLVDLLRSPQPTVSPALSTPQ